MMLSQLKYPLIVETRQNYPIYNKQHLTASILRSLHQVYEKILNYMNKCVYLPKMVPLKWGCKGVRGVWVCKEVKWIWKVMGRDPSHGIYLPTLKFCVPHLLCGTLVGGSCMVLDGELCYLSWSDCVSCKTWSQMCGSWNLPKFLLSEGSLTHVTRNIKENIYIQISDPSFNRNLGEYQLPHIWDQILHDTPSLQLK